MRIEYHRTLIADEVRNEAFHRALAAVIEPGRSIVADIGAGTGILGLMAARLGAKEVFLYETAEVAAVAEAMIARAGVENCHVIPCSSLEMQNPPRVDIVISETLGNYAFEEDILTTLADARRRHLRKGGIILPRTVRQLVAPVVASRLHDELTVWRATGARYGIDMSVPERMSLNNVYVRRIDPAELLPGGARQWDEADLTERCDTRRRGGAEWTIGGRASVVYGFAVWWELEVGRGIVLSTGPEAPRTHWEQLYFPLERPMTVRAGETLKVELKSSSGPDTGTHLSWSAERTACDGRRLERQRMDLDKGYLP